jgi:hypothetical protein
MSQVPTDRVPLAHVSPDPSYCLVSCFIGVASACKDTVVPLMFPVRGTDGAEIREVPIRENQNVIIGMGASNRNKALWGPDADEWRPERWLSSLPDALCEAKIPGVYSHLYGRTRLIEATH